MHKNNQRGDTYSAYTQIKNSFSCSPSHNALLQPTHIFFSKLIPEHQPPPLHLRSQSQSFAGHFLISFHEKKWILVSASIYFSLLYITGRGYTDIHSHVLFILLHSSSPTLSWLLLTFFVFLSLSARNNLFFFAPYNQLAN